MMPKCSAPLRPTLHRPSRLLRVLDRSTAFGLDPYGATGSAASHLLEHDHKAERRDGDRMDGCAACAVMKQNDGCGIQGVRFRDFISVRCTLGSSFLSLA